MRLESLSRYLVRATELNVIDVREGLLVRTERKPSVVNIFMSCAATGSFVTLLASYFVGKREVIALAVLSATIAYLNAKRTQRFELRISRLEFVARGKVGDNIGSIRTVCAADILWLEYQEDTSGADSAHHPGGLYAVVKRRSICLFPEIDERQAALIIERIKDRFPDFRSQWAGNSPFGIHFTSLGLNEPNRARR